MWCVRRGTWSQTGHREWHRVNDHVSAVNLTLFATLTVHHTVDDTDAWLIIGTRPDGTREVVRELVIRPGEGINAARSALVSLIGEMGVC